MTLDQLFVQLTLMGVECSKERHGVRIGSIFDEAMKKQNLAFTHDEFILIVIGVYNVEIFEFNHDACIAIWSDSAFINEYINDLLAHINLQVRVVTLTAPEYRRVI